MLLFNIGCRMRCSILVYDTSRSPTPIIILFSSVRLVMWGPFMFTRFKPSHGYILMAHMNEHTMLNNGRTVKQALYTL